MLASVRQCPHLDGKHTIIGQVNMGGDAKQILEDIAVVKLNGKGRPVVDIKMCGRTYLCLVLLWCSGQCMDVAPLIHA